MAKTDFIWHHLAKSMKPPQLIRPLVQGLHAYVPGEQPQIPGLIKLNTNENAYPPSPRVIRAVRAAVDGRLRLYPNPTAQRLREALGRLHRCRPENVIIGNGSDELLAMAVRAFVEPVSTGARGRCQGFSPSYSLYPVLARQHGASWSSVPLDPDFALPPAPSLARRKGWMPSAALTFVTTPNAPSGRGYDLAELDALCRALSGVVILDEAYVDFAATDAMALALRRPNVLVSRTFSKGYSLCFQRVGYFVGPRDLIAALDKIRDSYNVNGLGQVAALATLEDLAYYRRNFRRVIETRRRLGADL
ncbi:MAG TPA: histidinol-phosphate transaminase, partial [Planctomycetota bacterium]|nr:histidinol-phosphate transaminase [Planctomycetota bacterium]